MNYTHAVLSLIIRFVFRQITPNNNHFSEHNQITVLSVVAGVGENSGETLGKLLCCTIRFFTNSRRYNLAASSEMKPPVFFIASTHGSGSLSPRPHPGRVTVPFMVQGTKEIPETFSRPPYRTLRGKEQKQDTRACSHSITTAYGHTSPAA